MLVKEKKWIASFWRRIGALVIDTLLLGVVGFLLGLAFESVFVQLGNWGRLIGFGIALIYFGLMNSKLFDGQTIGKELLSLKVVNSDNQTISIGRSTLRSMVLSTPFFLNGLHLSSQQISSFLIYPLSLIVFGGLFSITYLYVFNRATRQSLHDLATGTYVVSEDSERQKVGTVWKTHLIIVGVFSVAFAILPLFTGKLVQHEPFAKMLSVQAAISSEPRVTHSNTSTSIGKRIGGAADGNSKATTYVTSQAFLSSNDIGDAAFARRLATIIIANYPEARNKDAIYITLSYGYDIGISAKWSSQTHAFIPSELRILE